MTIVRAAVHTNLMCWLVLIALIATHEVVQGELIMSATIQLTSARQFALGQWTHGNTP
jgi:hypothetical protein